MLQCIKYTFKGFMFSYGLMSQFIRCEPWRGEAEGEQSAVATRFFKRQRRAEGAKASFKKAIGWRPVT